MKIGIFGSIHDVELLKAVGYDEARNIALFDQFQPDIICGEVRKVDYDRGSGYMGPGEYRRYIFDYCRDRNIRFVPCDQYPDGVSGEYNGEPTPEWEAKWEKLMEDFWSTAKVSEVPCNSEAFNEVILRKMELEKELDPVTHKLVTEDRNADIINNIKAVVAENPNANILVIFGAEHACCLKPELEKLENVQVVFPLA